MANAATVDALREEFTTVWERNGARLGTLTAYRSRITGKVVVGLTEDNGAWNAIVLKDADATLLRELLDELL
jgi:hypothetical protein